MEIVVCDLLAAAHLRDVETTLTRDQILFVLHQDMNAVSGVLASAIKMPKSIRVAESK